MSTVGKEPSAGGRLVIVCDWLPPEFGAVGQYMVQRAEAAARDGADVTLIGLGRDETHEIATTIGAGRLKVLRIRAGVTPKHNLVRRGLWALARNFHLLSAVAAAQKGPGKVSIVFTGSPPFLSQMLVMANFVWRRDLTYRITDFYPETALASGHLPFLRPLLPLFQWVRKRVPTIEILGEDQGRRLIEGGVPASHLKLARDTTPVEIPADTQPAERPFDADALVLLYSGNMGVAHDVGAFCEGYRRHVTEGSNRVRLWVNGLGTKIAELEAYCRRHDLPLHLTPPVALSELPSVLMAADAHLVLLGKAYWGYVLPSKIYACLKAGQPVLYVGPNESDVAMLLANAPSRGHEHVQPGDCDGVFRALEALAKRLSLGDQTPAAEGRLVGAGTLP